MPNCWLSGSWYAGERGSLATNIQLRESGLMASSPVTRPVPERTMR